MFGNSWKYNLFHMRGQKEKRRNCLLFFSPIIVFDWHACGTISILFVHLRSHAHT